ncbi:MAG: DUF861 domain-containing protein [Granulosicoccus sp.]|nr:DUF861 domain-containing protein [Granulosicoccus sp.]
MANVLVETDPSPMKLEILNVDDWPIKTLPCGPVSQTNSGTEMHYIIEGAGEITSDDGAHITFVAGDMITVMPDTTCTWNITESVEKHSSIG